MQRREFLFSAGGLTLAACAGETPAPAPVEAPSARITQDRVAFITDEYSQDLAEAIAFAKEFSVPLVEVRGLWDTYGILLEPAKLKQARQMLDDAGLRCCALSTPLLKCVAPGVEPIERVELDIELAANSFPIPTGEQFGRSTEMLERSIEAASILGCNIVRCFSFWRAAEPASAYPLLLEKLEELAPVAERAGMKLAMENEHACNVADCGEAMQVLPQAPANVGLLWDVLNGVSTGETPYPDGYAKLDTSRIFHVQLKDADLSAGTERFTYTAVGQGDMPYAKIFKALAEDGYEGAISMETHFSLDGSGSRKEASRLSMQGVLAALEQQ